MPVQFTAFNTAGKPVLDLTLGHHGLPNRFEIPAGSYRLTVGWTGCPRNATVRAGRTTHVVVTLRGNNCSIRLPDIANENAVTGMSDILLRPENADCWEVAAGSACAMMPT